jgi:hypothetical protein
MCAPNIYSLNSAKIIQCFYHLHAMVRGGKKQKFHFSAKDIREFAR